MKSSERPLYEIKAALFRALAHPVRIRVLELLVMAANDPEQPDEVPVAALLADIDVSPSHLSGHLSVLRHDNAVTSRRSGSSVLYRVAHPAVADLLAAARRFLVDRLSDTEEQLTAAVALPALDPSDL
ncbi:MAG: ArsR/SmtB family transcription factor [Arachnia sp.]